MAANWNPPPPPPPPGPPPPSNPEEPSSNPPHQSTNNHIPPPPGPPGPPAMPKQTKQASSELEDKNAAYLAKMRAKQQRKSQQTKDAKPKIDLLGGINMNQANQANQQNNNINLMGGLNLNPVQKPSKRHVILPQTGLTERALFDKYRIEDNAKIGQGAFARIKVVKSVADGTKFALKMVKKKGRSRSDIEAFKKEILYLSKLTNHPNIIKMYDFCDSPQGLYMVLEMCNGGDVMQRMELVKTFKEQEAKAIVQQLVAGLCFFHKFNIVHRDLKLDNLMFNNGVLKIIDFGLAGDCTDGPLNTPCGTIHFTAPEVLQSYDYTTAADMWSLGVIIYLLICGFPPFFDNQGNEQKLFQIIKRAKFQFVNMFFDECHESVKDLITDLLRKRPVERLTAQEVRSHEWFTGIKQPKKVVAVINPFLDKEDQKQNIQNVQQNANPFLKQEAPKQQQQQFVPSYMGFQAPNQRQQVQQPGAMNQQWKPPGPPGPPGPPK